MSNATELRVESPSFSFYVDAGKAGVIEDAARISDFLTIRGRQGPRVAQGLRHAGWDGEVIFDHAAYEKPGREVNAEAWLEEQSLAGASRLLSPGVWVDYSRDAGALEQAITKEMRRVDVAGVQASTLVVATDHRWLTKHAETTAALFEDLDRPIALILGNSGDPLSVGGAVDGLITVATRVRHLSLLRIDHGGVGGVAFGAAHSSFGLRPGTRHIVPPGRRAFGKRDDRSARLFVQGKLDWFTAMTVAGWATVEVPENCHLTCCGGQPLRRFLDDRLRLQADHHNMVALADLATYVINAGQHERRRRFAELCRSAVGTYDRLGSMGLEPKSQLTAWALWA